MMPYCKETGVGLIPWSPIARGVLARPWSQPSTRSESDFAMNYIGLGPTEEANREIIGRVEKIAKDRGVSMAVVATTWSLSKGCCPILGLSKVERVADAVTAVKFKLTPEEVTFLEEPYTPKRVSGFVVEE